MAWRTVDQENQTTPQIRLSQPFPDVLTARVRHLSACPSAGPWAGRSVRSAGRRAGRLARSTGPADDGGTSTPRVRVAARRQGARRERVGAVTASAPPPAPAVEAPSGHATAALPGTSGALDRPGATGGTVGVVLGSAWYVAAVLGTGILLLPALAAEAAGPASILAVALVLVASVPLAATFAALAARHPDPGGVATYVRRALGATAARMTGYWFFFGVCVGSPVVALLGAEYVVAMVGGDRWQVYLVGAVLLVPPFVTNAVGLRLAGPVQLALTGALVAIVVLVVAAAAPATDPANLQPFLPHGWAGVGAAVSLFVWAFAGWEAVTHVAGEFRDPRRTIPLATAVALVVVGSAYLALQWVTVAALGDAAATSTVPLLDLVGLRLPDAARIAVAVVAAIVTLGVLNAYVAAFAKLGASLGRDRDLPRWLAPGAEAGGVPRRALVVVGALAAAYFTLAVVTGGDLAPFVLVHTSCMVAIYGTGVVAALRLLRRWTPGWWAALTASVLVTGLLVLAGTHLLVPAVLAVVAVVVGRVRGRLDGRGREIRSTGRPRQDSNLQPTD
ncbi:APC family permease [Cellulomonas biazotea]